MNSYQTQITLDNSQQILLSNLPFKEGTKLNINIEVVEEDIGDGLEYQQKIREEWS